MSSLDSAAVFKAKMRTLGIGDLHEVFLGLGWNTIGSFAFAAPANFSGTPLDEETFKTSIITPLFGDVADPRVPAVRRLHFESYTQTVGDLHRRSSRNDEDDKPKAMAPPERQARLEEVRGSSGLEIEGDLEPSDTLVDKYVHMQETTGVLKYIPLEEIGRRDNEVIGIKKDSFFKPDPTTGLMKFHEIGRDQEVDVSTDYKFYRALQRRGIAMQMGHLMSIKVHDKLIKWLIKELQRDAVPDHKKISMDQILRVDREIFIRMAEETRGGLQPDPVSDGWALDEILPKVMLEPRIVAFLNPLPLPYGGGQRSEPSGSKRRPDKEVERLQEENKRMRLQLQQKKDGKDAGKNKGRGKGGRSGEKSNARGNVRMPRELIGLSPEVNGFAACFDYNLQKGCSRSCDKNGSCDKGKHACMRCGSTSHGACSSLCPKKRN